MKTFEEIRNRVKADRALELLKEALSLLEGVEGPEQGLVAQAAKRAERQGAVEERSRERGRVAPVKVEALFQHWHKRAAELDDKGSDSEGRSILVEWWEYHRARAAEIHRCISELAEFLSTNAPEPESDAYAGTSPPAEHWLEPLTCPPTDGQRSGRRNASGMGREESGPPPSNA